MNLVKDSLINEVIRVSQTNLLGKVTGQVADSEAHEQCVREWIRNNAAGYREHFCVCLRDFSSQELANMLKELSETGKDLNEILKKPCAFTPYNKVN